MDGVLVGAGFTVASSDLELTNFQWFWIYMHPQIYNLPYLPILIGRDINI
jgi:hypothetical protein